MLRAIGCYVVCDLTGGIVVWQAIGCYVACDLTDGIVVLRAIGCYVVSDLTDGIVVWQAIGCYLACDLTDSMALFVNETQFKPHALSAGTESRVKLDVKRMLGVRVDRKV